MVIPSASEKFCKCWKNFSFFSFLVCLISFDISLKRMLESEESTHKPINRKVIIRNKMCSQHRTNCRCDVYFVKYIGLQSFFFFGEGGGGGITNLGGKFPLKTTYFRFAITASLPPKRG